MTLVVASRTKLRACAGAYDLLSRMCISTSVDRQLGGSECSLHQEDIDAVTWSTQHMCLQEELRALVLIASTSSAHCHCGLPPAPTYCGNITFKLGQHRTDSNKLATTYLLQLRQTCIRTSVMRKLHPVQHFAHFWQW